MKNTLKILIVGLTSVLALTNFNKKDLKKETLNLSFQNQFNRI
ncbi:hypothetical protein [Flavobacterium daemonense]|nr:hypothetical protein [Flavobacterium daemonense]